MPTYQYRAYLSTGEEICDTVEMDSMDEVLAWLRRRGLDCHEIEALVPIPNTVHAPAEEAATGDRRRPCPDFPPVPSSWGMTPGIYRNIDRSIDRSIDDDPEPRRQWPARLHDAGLNHVCRGSHHGHTAIELMSAMLRQRVRLEVASADIASALGRGALGRVLAGVAESVRGGAGVVEAMQDQRREFGDLSISFVRLGEQRWGVAESIRRYLAMRELHRARCGWSLGARFSARTRRFAITCASALDLSGDVLQSIRCSGIEMGRRHRMRIVEAMDQLRNGSSTADALPRQTTFATGFEPEFIGLVRAGEASSMLSEALRMASCI